MSEEKEKKIKQREKALDAMYLMVGFLVIVVVTVYAMNFGSYSLSKDPDEWGVFGDFFGGVLNPIFAFFSFALLLLNLHLQRKQLDKTEEQLELNREELAETRKALERSAQAQEDSKRVMDEQLKTQYLQQFDSLFFNLIKQFTEKIESLEKDNLIQRYYERIHQKRYVGSSWESVGYRTVLEIFYCVIERIDSAFEKQHYFSFEEKRAYQIKYIEVFRSVVPERVKHLIIFDCISFNPLFLNEQRKKLIENYPIFQNLALDGMPYKIKFWLLISSLEFSSQIFGDNLDFLKFKKKCFFKDDRASQKL